MSLKTAKKVLTIKIVKKIRQLMCKKIKQIIEETKNPTA